MLIVAVKFNCLIVIIHHKLKLKLLYKVGLRDFSIGLNGQQKNIFHFEN